MPTRKQRLHKELRDLRERSLQLGKELDRALAVARGTDGQQALEAEEKASKALTAQVPQFPREYSAEPDARQRATWLTRHIAFGNRLTLYLLLTCVVLAGIVALELRDTNQPEPEAGLEMPAATNTGVTLARANFVAPDLGTFDEILERPLFTKGREPPPEESGEAPVVATPGPPIRLRLEGVAISPDVKVAVVRDLNSNELLRLVEGASHQNWLVETVHASGASLKRGEQTQELKLEISTTPPNRATRVRRQRALSAVTSGTSAAHISVRPKSGAPVVAAPPKPPSSPQPSTSVASPVEGEPRTPPTAEPVAGDGRKFRDPGMAPVSAN